RRLAVTQAEAIDNGGQSTRGQTPGGPPQAMGLLERILQDPEEKGKGSLRPHDALVKAGRAMVYNRLVGGRLPAYREVFPKKTTTKLALKAGPFLTAIRQASIMTDEESKRVTFSFAKKKLTLQARGAETGRSKVEMPLEYDGKAVEINFDPRFLVEMLRVLEPDAALTLELVDGNSPALFKSGDNYSYVVMPLS